MNIQFSMGVSIGRGPSLEEDSLGYINSDVAEMNIESYGKRETDYFPIEINPVVARKSSHPFDD